eukprot:TRINITY_DN5783_c0_g2_i1.p4 TRINITY_DN5783_c0_g2~~TRINITY_DN5783_c0_g2_i1.p4  ORF type:complete len:158 (-),score=0.87 TRINITY_DN5783_c0_g2_i1:1311-1784(-)
MSTHPPTSTPAKILAYYLHFMILSPYYIPDYIRDPITTQHIPNPAMLSIWFSNKFNAFEFTLTKTKAEQIKLSKVMKQSSRSNDNCVQFDYTSGIWNQYPHNPYNFSPKQKSHALQNVLGPVRCFDCFAKFAKPKIKDELKKHENLPESNQNQNSWK